MNLNEPPRLHSEPSIPRSLRWALNVVFYAAMTSAVTVMLLLVVALAEVVLG